MNHGWKAIGWKSTIRIGIGMLLLAALFALPALRLSFRQFRRPQRTRTSGGAFLTNPAWTQIVA